MFALPHGSITPKTAVAAHGDPWHVVHRLSIASDGSQANAQSQYPSISADGRCIAFVSYASNLVAGDTNGKANIFVHDRQTEQSIRVSIASNGTEAISNHRRARDRARAQTT